MISIRGELIPQKPVFKRKLKNRRCVVPADGLYFWKKTGKKSAIPYRFVFPDTTIFSMAGLWEEFEDEAGK
ncbi:MAG: SOS response-associated peptidase [Flammeovirgaceae bacterium]|nr:SOS response-associated peptidase [Flammeovirgaceae bacterium]